MYEKRLTFSPSLQDVPGQTCASLVAHSASVRQSISMKICTYAHSCLAYNRFVQPFNFVCEIAVFSAIIEIIDFLGGYSRLRFPECHSAGR